MTTCRSSKDGRFLFGSIQFNDGVFWQPPLGERRIAGEPFNSHDVIPIGSMYAIYGNIYHQYTSNVSIYTIHGSYGIWSIKKKQWEKWWVYVSIIQLIIHWHMVLWNMAGLGLSRNSWEWKIIPTDVHSMIFQRARAKNHQPLHSRYPQ